jgi:hypothetical protein
MRAADWTVGARVRSWMHSNANDERMRVFVALDSDEALLDQLACWRSLRRV